jgi:hypothetical protein
MVINGLQKTRIHEVGSIDYQNEEIMVRAGAGSRPTARARLHDCRIQETVYQATYNQQAAKIHTTALAIHNAHFCYNIERGVDVQGCGVAVRLASRQYEELARIAFWRGRSPRWLLASMSTQG